MRVYLISTSKTKNYIQSVTASAYILLEPLKNYGLLEILQSATLRSNLRRMLLVTSVKKSRVTPRKITIKDVFQNMELCRGDPVSLELGSKSIPMTFIRRTLSSFAEKIKVLKYYDRCFELTNPDEYATLKESRKTNAQENPDNNTARLHAGEAIKKQQYALLKRAL